MESIIDSKPEIRICQWKNDAPFAYSMTYDEGTVDVLANALPIHERFGFPGHADVVAGQLGRKRNAFGSSLNAYVHMGVEELKFLVSKGWGVGNHSWSHYMYPCQPGLDLYREVVWSKYRLEDMMDCPVRIFTIPNDSFNYQPVIGLVKDHYLACANIEGAPNREGFDLYNIGNFIMGSGIIPKRAGWPEELYTPNLSLAYLKDAWLYETTHLVMHNTPQDHKCITPAYLEERFQKLTDISEGALWAAKPDDVIDYELLRRNLHIENVNVQAGFVSFGVGGEWPVGVVNAFVTIKVSGVPFVSVPKVRQHFHRKWGGYDERKAVESIVKAEDGWLFTLELAPGRTVELIDG